MLLDPKSSALVVIDMQSRLVPLMHNVDVLRKNVSMLVRSASELGIPMYLTEQYPEKLGATETLFTIDFDYEHRYSKRSFSALEDTPILNEIATKSQIIICGIESHVCISQSVLQLLQECDSKVFIVSDAISARVPSNHSLGLSRMEKHGAELVSTEMVVFEWLKSSTHPKFKTIAPIFK